MAELKKRVLHLSTGKQIKLFGNSLSIGKSLEIGEGVSPNILHIAQRGEAVGHDIRISNPYNLNELEVMEIADFNMRLWLDLKERIRQHGISSVKIFNKET